MPGKPMIEGGDYLFFAIGPNETSTAFRADLGEDNVSPLKIKWARIQRSTTSVAAYEKATMGSDAFAQCGMRELDGGDGVV